MNKISEILATTHHKADTRKPFIKDLAAAMPAKVFLPLMAVIIVVSVVIPVFDNQANGQRYVLDAKATKLIGEAPVSMAKQITDNVKNQSYEFNSSLRSAAPGADKKEVKPGQYSVTVYKDPSKGVQYYDPATKQEFTIKPKYESLGGQKVGNRLVFPLKYSVAQDVHTFMGDGVKNDLVLAIPQGDTKNFQYSLDLPSTLEARSEADGSIGIYTGNDSGLFSSNISYGTDKDRQLVQNAQKHAKKDMLVFSIPAPIIKQSGSDGVPAETAAKFVLSGNTLTVEARGLAKLSYPVTIDPSLVVTSTADFEQNSSNDNVNIATNQIKRRVVTSGNITAAWTPGSSLLGGSPARYSNGVVAYNGKLYSVGGYDGTNPRDTVEYATISGTSVINWTTTSSLVTASTFPKATIYNGYMYVLGGGGAASTTTPTANVQYAKIDKTTGALSAFQNATGTLNTARAAAGAVAYRGFLYIGGGCSPACSLQSVEYAPIFPNGNVGTFSFGPNFNTVGASNVMTGYNGFLYSLGNGSTGAVYYSAIKADGSLSVSGGAWKTASSYPATIVNSISAFAYEGHMYALRGGDSQTANYVASINADGSLTSWMPLNAMPTSAAQQGGAAAYNGFIYYVGGLTGGITASRLVYTGTINTTAMTPSVGLSGPSLNQAGGAYTPRFPAVAAYNGYLYVAGGCTQGSSGAAACNTTIYANSQYSKINQDGSLAGWTIGPTLTAPTRNAPMVAYGNWLFIFGGYSGSMLGRIQCSLIGADGVPGTWTSTAVGACGNNQLPIATCKLSATAYNGFVYILAGQTASGCAMVDTGVSNVYYASIDTNGNVGTTLGWTPTTTLPNPVVFPFSQFADFATNVSANSTSSASGYMYITGALTGTGFVVEGLYTTINATTGALGSWTTTTNSNGGNAYSGFYEGRIVTADGGSVASYVPTVNGSSGAYVGGTDMVLNTSTARAQTGGAIYNGFWYMVGGSANGISGGGFGIATTTYGSINGGGTGKLSDLTTASSITTARYGSAAVAYNGKIYMSGGFTGTQAKDVQYATINEDGSLGTWASVTSGNFDASVGRQYHGMVVVNGYIYVIGGFNGTAGEASIKYAPIAANGDITAAWGATTAALTTGLEGSTIQTFNGKIYVVGGSTDNTATNAVASVYVATPAANGDITTWYTNTSMATARWLPGGTIYNGYIYMVGGQNSTTTGVAGSGLNSYEYAQISTSTSCTTACVSSWTTGKQKLEVGRSGQSVFGANGYLYWYNGIETNALQDRVQAARAPVMTSGSLGNWESINNSGTTATAGIELSGLAQYRGFVYFAGAHKAGAGQTATYYVGTQSQPRIGTYSYMFDGNVDTAPYKILLNGSNTGNPGLPGTLGQGGVSITYRGIASNMTTWGLSTLINPGTVTQWNTLWGITPLDTSGNATGVAMALILNVYLDESQSTSLSYTDAGGNSAVTDFELWYHAASVRRLRGGKTFTNEVKQSLDTAPG